MNAIEDVGAVFYFAHQKRIDEWAALARQASDCVHRFLRTLGDDMDGVGRAINGEVEVSKDPDDKVWPSFLVFRPPGVHQGCLAESVRRLAFRGTGPRILA